MARCPHNNVQQFTDLCLDCGRNINESDEEYLNYLMQRKRGKENQKRSLLIEKLEEDLGITHPGNRQNSSDYSEDYNGNW